MAGHSRRCPAKHSRDQRTPDDLRRSGDSAELAGPSPVKACLEFEKEAPLPRPAAARWKRCKGGAPSPSLGGAWVLDSRHSRPAPPSPALCATGGLQRRHVAALGPAREEMQLKLDPMPARNPAPSERATTLHGGEVEVRESDRLSPIGLHRRPEDSVVVIVQSRLDEDRDQECCQRPGLDEDPRRDTAARKGQGDPRGRLLRQGQRGCPIPPVGACILEAQLQWSWRSSRR
mmetsp:Transcript_63514/g.175653  ORF Transcript_63514/g.175653 Transcript_63514/m.175653 type:complete len:232 (+) Transcript_63514:83-778(+)